MKASDLEKLLDDKFDQVVVAIRASHPSAQDIKELNKKMDEHIQAHAINDKRIDEALTRIEPYIKQAEDDKDFRAGLEERGKKLGFWGGIWLALAGVVASIYYGLKHIK